MKQPIKMYGLQRSGTNLVHTLILNNYQTVSMEAVEDWKHGFCASFDRTWQNIPYIYIICVKNPYAWIDSIYRYFQRSYAVDSTVDPRFTPSMTLADFIRSPHYEFPSPAHRWSAMNLHWLHQIPSERRYVIRHEQILGGPDNQISILQRVGQWFGLQPRTDSLQPILDRIDVGGRSQPGPMNHDYYLHNQFIERFTKNDLSLIRNSLDPSALAEFGYRDDLPGPGWDPLNRASLESAVHVDLSHRSRSFVTWSHFVTGVSTRTTLSINPAQTSLGAPVTFTARVEHVAGSPTPLPEGTVAFLNQSVLLGTAPLVQGVAHFTTDSLFLGHHTLTALYHPTPGFSPSDSSAPLIVGSTHQRFVSQLYNDLLGRQIDNHGLAAWTQCLDQGKPPEFVARALVASREYMDILIDGFYISYLGRNAAPFEIESWIGQYQSGLTLEDVEARILASDEFFERAGCSNPRFVDSLYKSLMGKSPDPMAQNVLAQALDAHSTDRRKVALAMKDSDQCRERILVKLFLKFLHHAPEPHRLAVWKSRMASGISSAELTAAFVAGNDYLQANHLPLPCQSTT